jgi:hypothetical protein
MPVHVMYGIMYRSREGAAGDVCRSAAIELRDALARARLSLKFANSFYSKWST